MKKLYFDIETLPANEGSKEILELLFKKKQEKSAKKKKKKAGCEEVCDIDADDFDSFFRKTSFDGAFGRVLCIAYAINDGELEVICNPDDEKKTLKEFWEIAKDVDLFIGHNIMDFDLRFLCQRSAILGVKPTRDLSFARYRHDPIFDTMKEWSKWGDPKNCSSLEHIALAMGIPSPKDDIDGSQVYDFFMDGKVKDICDYCKKDVATTRLVYKRMNFE